MTGLELMVACGYDINHLTADDADVFWAGFMRTGITGPREPMEIFVESLQTKRIELSNTQPKADYRKTWGETDIIDGYCDPDFWDT